MAKGMRHRSVVSCTLPYKKEKKEGKPNEHDKKWKEGKEEKKEETKVGQRKTG